MTDRSIPADGTDRLLIIGYGYAGRRFHRAADHLAGSGRELVVAGICDVSPGRLPAGVAGFADLDAALDRVQPTVAVVTVNEEEHESVYRRLGSAPPMLVVSEKPLTTDLPSAVRAAGDLSRHLFSMNLVERYSPAVEECAKWLASLGNGELVRAESWWGKHRLGDPRPTFGVLSELIHPIDLMRFLFAKLPLAVDAALVVRGDYRPHAGDVPESVDVHGRLGNAPLLVHSSFAWPRRRREISALVRDGKDLFRFELHLDTPHWDTDDLHITSISRSGRIEDVHRFGTVTADVDPGIRGVAKVTAFLDRSLARWRGHGGADGLVDLATAVELQRLLDDVGKADPCRAPAHYGHFHRLPGGQS